MPQVFQVLCCYKCLVFQVHQVKKSNKWECKLCGEKQSIKRHYGVGTGKECRHHVQKLNELRGEKNENKLSNVDNSGESDSGSEEEFVRYSDKISSNKESKWSSYIEKEEPNKSSDDEKESLFGKEVILELPKKRKKAFNKYCRIKKNKKKQSEATDFEDEMDTLDIATCNDIKNKDFIVACKKPVKRFVPPVTNSTSKWADHSEKLHNTDSEASAKSLADSFFEPTLNLVNQDNDVYVNSDNMKETKYHKDVSENDKKNTHKTVVSTLKQNSKWIEFIDNCENEEDNSHDSVENIPQKTIINASNIFSTCDDNELDSVLEI